MFEAFTNRSYSLIGFPDKKKPKYKELLGFIHRLYPMSGSPFSLNATLVIS